MLGQIFMTLYSTVHVKTSNWQQQQNSLSLTLSCQCPFTALPTRSYEEIYLIKNLLLFHYLPEEISPGLSKPEKKDFC